MESCQEAGCGAGRGLLVPGLGLWWALVIPSSGKGLKGLRRGRAGTWWCHFLAVGPWAASHFLPGRCLLLAQGCSRALLGAVQEGGPQRCLPPGFLGALSQPQEPLGSSRPPSHPVLPECSVRNVQGGLGGGLGASAWQLDPLGRAVWGEDQAGLQGSQRRRRGGLSQCSSGGPPAPQPPPRGPPPTLPQGLPPPSSVLRPPGPWHGRVSPPANHIWFSLGSPRMPLPEAPLSRGRWAGGLGVIR